ncbi:MAG: hypothetical protein SGPRY_001963 [Prymnesium sp.]
MSWKLLSDVRAAEQLREKAAAPESQRIAPLLAESTFRYSSEQYPLTAALVEVLQLPCPLEELHREIEGFSTDPACHNRVMRAKKRLLLPLTDTVRSKRFHLLYDQLVLRELAPQLLRTVGVSSSTASSFYYSAVPTLRVQQPSSLRQIRPHCDGMYDLQEGALNFWLPLTPVEPESTLHIESEPGRRDYHPLLPKVGEMVRRIAHSECIS